MRYIFQKTRQCLGGLALVAYLVPSSVVLAQKASSFQNSCENIHYSERNGTAGIAASCRTMDGRWRYSYVEILGIENTDGDLTHTGKKHNFYLTCKNMNVLLGGPSQVMLAGDCRRRNGQWVGTSTQLWDINNIDGVLQYSWAPRPAVHSTRPSPSVSRVSTPRHSFPSGYFRLTSMFREGKNECLESSRAGNGPIHMDSCQNVSGQLWKAAQIGGGYVRLTSMFREGHNECLESNARGNARSHMDRCQNVTGQMWKVLPENNGYFRLTSKFREGHNECLESNQPNNGGSHMDVCQNVSGQLWKVKAR